MSTFGIKSKNEQPCIFFHHQVTKEIFFSTQFFFYQMVKCGFNTICVLAIRFDFHKCLDLIFSIPATHSSIIQCHITEEISQIVIYFYIRQLGQLGQCFASCAWFVTG